MIYFDYKRYFGFVEHDFSEDGRRETADM